MKEARGGGGRYCGACEEGGGEREDTGRKAGRYENTGPHPPVSDLSEERQCIDLLLLLLLAAAESALLSFVPSHPGPMYINR